ncbi:MAG: hypothetical protein Q8Q12_22355 [bacterium]|nr:hypothetical protein [bacterium]
MSIESKDTPTIDPRELVRWLGPQGAKAGLLQSKLVTVEVLMGLAKSMGIAPTKSASRQHLVDDIVKLASQRIDKTIDELYLMSKEELIAYFERLEPSSEELLDLLRSLELTPRKEGHRGLVDLAARELSETGRFLRISAPASKFEQK